MMDDCGRDCECSARNLSRRGFLKASAGVAGLVYGAKAGSASPGDIPDDCRKPAPQAWFGQLAEPGQTIVYEGKQLQNLIFPLGGIGTGTVWLHGSGRLVNWQIFNNIQKDTLVDDTFFAVRVEQEGEPVIVRALQREPAGSFPGIADVRFIGQYPVATLLMSDPNLPIDIELEALNPLVPLDEEASGIPCAVFAIKATNKTNKRVRVSFMSSLQNAVGHSGKGASRSVLHGTYGGNVNSVVADDLMTAVRMKANPGRPAELHPPIELLVDHDNMPMPPESPVTGLSLITVGQPKTQASIQTVYWLARGDLKLLGGAVLKQIARGVREQRAVLLLSGMNNPLLDRLQPTVPSEIRRRETVFAGFDDKGFGQWTAEGDAFREPKSGTSPGQSPVSGFLGTGFVNTFDPDDHPKGKLTSPIFVIKEKLISLLVGGGNHPNACCVNLLVDGNVVRTATGKNTEQLERIEWDVSELANREARIEIVDSKSNPWGHILVDDIRFSNLPIDAITADEADDWNNLIADAGQADPMTPVGVGRGKVVRVPLELGGKKEGVDPIAQRDGILATIAPLADASYRPQVGLPTDAPSFGTMCLATPDVGASVALTWENREELLREFSETGQFVVPAKGSGLTDALPPTEPSGPGRTHNAALCVATTINPRMTGQARFAMTWHFPNQYYPQNNYRISGPKPTSVGNMYVNWYQNAFEVARSLVNRYDDLRRATMAYRDLMFDTTLPQYFIDAVAANVSIIRSPTCFRAKDGTFFGFEGCVPGGGGCCPMNCNHVWNYEQTLAKLWPALERDMRKTELKFHQRDDGGTNHRVAVPRDNPQKHAPPVADGQCGAVLKAYREHLQSRDRRFLDDYWPHIKKAMDFAISEWDRDSDGVMEWAQFNTYDRVIFGQNTFVTSLYLAALRAGEEMAKLSRDDVAAERYRSLFASGSQKVAKTLFDGEYYIEDIDSAIASRKAWDEAHKQIGQELKPVGEQEGLQGGYGKGCWSDQVVGQWWARILDLGDILPNDQVQSALKAIYKHSFLFKTAGFEGTQRFLQFGDGDDKGLLCGSWPKGGRPDDPIYYRDEYWTGIEYQVAAHKIYEGQLTEALAIVRGARERYDGIKKSPWNEIECGDYYARALSSWSLLLAAQGYAYDGPARKLTLGPKLDPANHRSFFTTADGWGRFEQKRIDNQQTVTLELMAGRCDLKELRLGLPPQAKAVQGLVEKNGRKVTSEVSFDKGFAVIRLTATAMIEAEDRLTITLDWS